MCLSVWDCVSSLCVSVCACVGMCVCPSSRVILSMGDHLSGGTLSN